MKIILSTHNSSKAEQIKALLQGFPAEVLTLSEVGVRESGVEDGKTLAENAAKKARFAREKTGEWSMADDTGLFIDALNGAPGIHAARWAGKSATTEEIMQFTLEKLRGVPLSKRTARFETVAVIVSPEGVEHVFSGEVRGVLLEAPRVPCQPNMPYSALFQPEGETQVWAEMSVEAENKISHRGKAFKQVRDFLSQLGT